MTKKQLKARISELESIVDYYASLITENQIYIGSLEAQIEDMEKDYISPSYVRMLEEDYQLRTDMEGGIQDV